MRNIIAATALIGLLAHGSAAAVTIDFEDVAPPSGSVPLNISPPYTEDGFILTPQVSGALAVIDAAASPDMPGNSSSDYLLIPDDTTVTLTLGTAPGVFDLTSFLFGPLGGSTGLTLTGTLASGGAPLVLNFPNISTATTLSPNWTGLTAVTFDASFDSGIDDIVASATVVPLPAGLPLALAGFGMMVMLRRGRTG
ncbi:MAG: hypothetical protein AAF371_13520 [Pseudomonadota bacterium]